MVCPACGKQVERSQGVVAVNTANGKSELVTYHRSCLYKASE